MKIYHVVTAKSKAELEVIKEVQPPFILCSFFYFKNKPLADFIDEIGYEPEILFDSGAFSAWSQGKHISLTEYMEYLEENAEYIRTYINLDVFGDNELSFDYYKIMKRKGFAPIPVVHYGPDFDHWLERYYKIGERHIAIGGTVPVHNKNTIAEFIKISCALYADVKFHLLGSTSKKIIKQCDLYSLDSSTWFIQAKNGRPPHIKGTSTESKKERAKYNLLQEIALNDL